jgi:hypothetical protein
MGAKSGNVTRPVAVAVSEGPQVHLVDDRLAPPGSMWCHGPIMTVCLAIRLRLARP